MRWIAFAALVSCGAYAQPVNCNNPLNRFRVQCLPAFRPAQSMSFSAPGALPTCTAATSCVALCKVNGAGAAWECLDASGDAGFGTVTQGTGTTYGDAFGIGLKTMTDVTTAKTPRLVSTSIDSLFKADHTIMFGGYATTQTDATFQTWAIMNDGAGRIFYTRNESGSFKCIWSGAGGTRTATATYAAVDGWSVVSCRQSGTAHYARNNGSDSSSAAGAAITADLTAGTSFYMGDQGGSLPIRGPLAFVAFFSDDKTDTQLRAIENAFWGVGLDAGGGLSGIVGLPNDAGTRVDFFAASAHVVSPDRGLRTVGQSTDDIQAKWAADPFDVSSWTNVGTPIVGTNVASGPFSQWKNTAECDYLEDDSAAAFEGKASAELQRSTSGGAAHAWNIRVWAAAGDSGLPDSGLTSNKMRVAILSDGVFLSDAGAEEDCDFTLDNTVRPYDCLGYTTDGGVSTVKGRVLLGHAAAAVGNIVVCNAQDTAHVYPQLTVTNATAFGFSSEVVDPSAWPSTAIKGKYEIVFTPLNNIASPPWDRGSDNIGSSFIYLFDAYGADAGHNLVIVGGYQAAGRLLARTQGTDGLMTEFLVDGVSFTPGQRYAISMEWYPQSQGRCSVALRMNPCYGAASACRATQLVRSEQNGRCPGQPANVKLGNRYDNSVPTSVFVDAVRVYR